MWNKVMPAAWVVKLVCWPIRIASASGSFSSCQQLLTVPRIVIRLSLPPPVCKSSLATSKPAHRLADHPFVLGSSAHSLRSVIGHGELLGLPSTYHLLIIRLQGQNASNLGGPPPGGDGKEDKDKKVSRSSTEV